MQWGPRRGRRRGPRSLLGGSPTPWYRGRGGRSAHNRYSVKNIYMDKKRRNSLNDRQINTTEAENSPIMENYGARNGELCQMFGPRKSASEPGKALFFP